MTATTSIANVHLGGRDYPVVRVNSCLTCQSPYRTEIESMALDGKSWSTIIGSIPPDSGLTARNIADHWSNGHLPVRDAAVAAHLEHEASRLQTEMEPAVAQIVDELDFARALLDIANNRMASGELAPDIKDALKAVDLLARYSPIEISVTTESEFREAFVAIDEHAKEVMTPAQYTQFGELVCANETISRLAAAWDERNSHG